MQDPLFNRMVRVRIRVRIRITVRVITIAQLTKDKNTFRSSSHLRSANGMDMINVLSKISSWDLILF